MQTIAGLKNVTEPKKHASIGYRVDPFGIEQNLYFYQMYFSVGYFQNDIFSYLMTNEFYIRTWHTSLITAHLGVKTSDQ